MKAYGLVLATLFVSLGCSTHVTPDASSDVDEASRKGSDLKRDLAKPAGDRGTPFQQSDAKELRPDLLAGLGSLASRCLLSHEKVDPRGSWYILPTTTTCATELAEHEWNDAAWRDQTTFKLGDKSYTAVTWDGLDSDGGDECDLAIYDEKGKRIAVYTELYVDIDVYSAISAVSNANVKTVTDPWVAESVIDADMMNPNGVQDAPAKALGAQAAVVRALLESCVTVKTTAAGRAGVVQTGGNCFALGFEQTASGVTFRSIDIDGSSTHQDMLTVVRWDHGNVSDIGVYAGGTDNRLGVYKSLATSGDLLLDLAAAVGANLRSAN